MTNTYLVTSLSDTSEEGTFRNAIYKSRSNVSSVIVFFVSGTVKLTSSLPTIISKVTIDGTNAPGYVGTPVVEIDCNQYNGLVLDKNANLSIILGLSITNAVNSGIIIKSNGNKLISNYIGIDIDGNVKGNNKNGICICKSIGNTIGDNPINKSGYASNVISGNGENGIKLFSSVGNTIVSNFIGTDPSGTISYPNKKNGLLMINSKFNQIGGTVYTNSDGETNNPTGSKGTVPIVYIFPPLGNLISGNDENGVLIEKSSENVFNGNFIGVSSSGISALGNKQNGVHVNESDGNVFRGCLVDENPFVYYNVCSGNELNGIRVTNSNNTVIQGNFFGIGANNGSIVSNKMDGILVDGNSNNTTDGGVIPLGNVSAGNGKNGIHVSGNASGYISFNTFGGLYAFFGPAPNGENGALIDSTGKNNVLRTNVFSGNKGHGIKLAGYSNNVTVESVIVGLDTDGSAPLPNKGDGIHIGDYSNNNVIGVNVASVIPRSAFSGNYGNGIHITDYASENKVNLSFVGLSVLGKDLNCFNKRNGILLDGNANRNFVGTPDTEISKITNYSASNILSGIKLEGLCENNIIEGNVVGYDFNGDLAPNKQGSIVDKSQRPNIIRNNITN